MTAPTIKFDMISDSGGRLQLSENQEHYVRNVRRLKPGDKVRIVDNYGHVGTGTIVEEYGIFYVNVEEVAEEKQPETKLRLILSPIRGNATRDQIAVLSELGVDEVWFVQMRRTIVRWSDPESRLETLSRVALEATRRVGKPWVPKLQFFESLRTLKHDDQQVNTKLFLWEHGGTSLQETELSLNPGIVECLIGPEGGIEEEEAELLMKMGYVPVILKGGILRSFTASIVASSILLHKLHRL